MTAKDGKPCKKCGGARWYKNGKCASCEKDAQYKRYHDDPERWKEWAREHRRQNPERARGAGRRCWEKHKEEYRELNRKWRRENPEKAKASKQRWIENNPDKEHERRRKRRERDREKIYESNRLWKKQNPDKIKAINHRRSTRKTAAGGSYTSAEWQALVSHFGGKCLCCGRTDVNLTVDHVIPVAKGGTSNIDNLQPLCFSCNSRKGDRVVDYRPSSGLGRWIQKKLFGG
jgi:5-methylcytosine-specific restriction endonuclease McrA